MDGQNMEAGIAIAEQVGEAALSAVGGSTNKTIVSGIARVQKLADAVTPVLSEFEALVSSMGGARSQEGQFGTFGAKSAQPEAAGSAVDLHSAAQTLEGLFSAFAGLVKRARAAHG